MGCRIRFGIYRASRWWIKVPWNIMANNWTRQYLCFARTLLIFQRGSSTGRKILPRTAIEAVQFGIGEYGWRHKNRIDWWIKQDWWFWSRTSFSWIWYGYLEMHISVEYKYLLKWAGSLAKIKTFCSQRWKSLMANRGRVFLVGNYCKRCRSGFDSICIIICMKNSLVCLK